MQEPINNALNLLKNSIKSGSSEISSMSNQYGYPEASSFYLSGGKPNNVAGMVLKYLKSKNLPGQSVFSKISKSSQEDPINRIKTKMISGENITDKEKRLIKSAGVMAVGGITSSPEMTPGTPEFQNLKNDVFQLRLAKERNFYKPDGQIDLNPIGKIEQLAKQYLPRQAITAVKKMNTPEQRLEAYLQELEVLLQ